MKRRDFVQMLGGSAAWSCVAGVRASRTPVIGLLNGASAALSQNYVRPFHQGLDEAGYVEGRNVVVQYRWADGHYERLPALAADLIRQGVDVIAATSTPAGLPAKAATKSIPIVFVTGSDPIERGLVANFGRPEGNVTGTTTLAVELGRKRLELMREVVPSPGFIGVLINPTGPNLASVSGDMQGAARALDQPIHVVHASNELDLDAAFESLTRRGVGALVIGTDTFFNSQSKTLAALALRHRIPSIYQYREFVAAGGLMSYAGSILEAYRLAGVYCGRILRGERPSALPVQRSNVTDLYVNLKTAAAFGLKVPTHVLARATDVIA